jgi:hypothetical protein
VKKKETHGGARPGAGRKDPVTKKRMIFTIDLQLAELLEKETNKSATVETALKVYYKELLTSNNTSMNEVTLIPASEERNGLIVRKVRNNGNDQSVEIRKVAINGRDNGIVATLNLSGFIGENGISWRGSFKAYDMPAGLSLESLIKDKWEDIKHLF